MPEMNTAKLGNSLADIDWEDLLETLEAEKCILFLGSGAYKAPGGGDLDAALAQWLDVQNPEHPQIRLYHSDGFFLFKGKKEKRRITTRIKDFYNQAFPETEELLGRLAEVPFSMIFTLTPDNLLTRVLDTRGFDYQFDFYYRHRPAPEEYERPTRQKPLLYNLLGNIEEPESMLLTHSDFFDYLKSDFRDISMHPKLKDQLKDAERFIFLGLPYEKWYFQLLLHVLSMHSDAMKDIERLALDEFEDPGLHKLYTEEFKIEFIPADVELFLGELHRQCGAKGLLKQVAPPDEALAALPDLSPEALRNMLGDAQTLDAIRHLKAFLDRRKPRSLPLLNDLTVLQNRYNLLRQREWRGTIYPNDLSTENAQVAEQFIDLLTNAQALINV